MKTMIIKISIILIKLSNLQNIFLQLQTKLYINKLNNHKSNTNGQMQLQIKIINNFSSFAELLTYLRKLS